MNVTIRFFIDEGNAYNGCPPLLALQDRTIFSECKEGHQECSSETMVNPS